MNQETRDSLLLRIRDHEDARAWQQFVAVYRPMIYRIARRRGLQDCDAEDLTQRVLMSVARSIGSWEKDAKRGGFRIWLSRVARNAIVNYVTRGPQDASLGGSDFLEVCHTVESHDAEVQRMIDEEFARSQLRAAAAIVKPQVKASTWDAFWLTTVKGMSIDEVVQKLNLSPGAVYGARARVMRQLQAAAATIDRDAPARERAANSEASR